jgi:1-deoxy-D-xylulose-5-phosphate reductoisomerase
MKNVVLLGSTGSIGTSSVKVAEDLPDRIRLLGLAAGNNLELLLEQTRKHRPEAISISDPAKAQELRDSLGTAGEVFSGTDGLLKLATLPEADIVLIAIVGTAGLQPALAAIRAGKDIAVASKEILVMAGEIVMNGPGRGVRVLAVDSEHSAITNASKASRRRPCANSSGVRRSIRNAKARISPLSAHLNIRRGSWAAKSRLIRRRFSTKGWR